MNKNLYLQAGLMSLSAIYFIYRYLTQPATIYLIFASLFVFLLLAHRALPLRWRGLATNLGFSLIFLDLVFHQVDLALMFRSLREANYWMLIPAVSFLVVSYPLRAWRWGWLLRQTKDVNFSSLLSTFAIGIAANIVMPARAGEFLRAYLLGHKEGISKTTVFASVVVERICDGLTVVFSLLFVVALIGFRRQEMKYMAVLGLAFYFGVILALALLYFRKGFVIGLAKAVLPEKLSARAIGLFESFLAGVRILRDWRQVGMIVLLSLLTWAAIGLSLWPVLLAFDFGAPVPSYTPLLLIGILGLSVMIPTPGGVGPFQYGCLLGLRITFASGMSTLPADFDEKAAAFSLVLHLSHLIPEVIVGLAFFLGESIRWEEVGVYEAAEVGDGGLGMGDGE